jgi:hypothetical protein
VTDDCPRHIQAFSSTQADSKAQIDIFKIGKIIFIETAQLQEFLAQVQGGGPGWPRAKSLTLIPEAYRFALVYGINPHTGQPSPAGRWQVRNVIRWVRPNPPVGALGKKWRPATSELVVATPDDDRRYWDDVATRVAASPNTHRRLANGADARYDLPSQQRDGNWSTLEQNDDANPAGAPLLDWWKITPKGYEGAHYAVYPPELCGPPIEAMCPRRVCRTCGTPSTRETETERLGPQENTAGRNGRMVADAISKSTTTGWSSCGCPGTDGIRLDGFHDGTGWRPGIVLDPFAGTGTTVAVANHLGRHGIGIELSADYLKLARWRLQDPRLRAKVLRTDPPKRQIDGQESMFPAA